MDEAMDEAINIPDDLEQTLVAVKVEKLHRLEQLEQIRDDGAVSEVITSN